MFLKISNFRPFDKCCRVNHLVNAGINFGFYFVVLRPQIDHLNFSHNHLDFTFAKLQNSIHTEKFYTSKKIRIFATEKMKQKTCRQKLFLQWLSGQCAACCMRKMRRKRTSKPSHAATSSRNIRQPFTT